MSTLIKVAATAKEIDAVFKLRHQVYVVEDQKFGGEIFPDERIIDRFDAMPFVANIIAVENDVPIGTLRLAKNGDIGLPIDKYFDFSEYNNSLLEKDKEVLLASAGMLAITYKGRNKRNVIMALFKMATGICMEWGITHVVATANHETVSVYEHLGFESIGDKVWIDEIANYIVPMAAPLSKPIEWAFGGLVDNRLDAFWLDYFSGRFERILLSSGEALFRQGDEADSVYIVDDGWISISIVDEDGQELNLAQLSKGALFGELALIDDSPRSANAVAVSGADVIRLSKSDFLGTLSGSEAGTERLLKVFANRIRSADELAMVMAYAPQTGRVRFALDKLREAAVPHRKLPGVLVSKTSPLHLAQTAGVREYEVRRILALEKKNGCLDYSERWIHFFQD